MALSLSGELSHYVSLVIFIMPLTILNIELCHSLSVTIKESNSYIIDRPEGLDRSWQRWLATYSLYSVKCINEEVTVY